MTRKQIYQIIEKDDGSSFWSHIYDIFMLCMIILSVVPLMFWEEYPIFKYIEAITTAVFIIDYLLRWATADVRQGKDTAAFLKYPFTFWAIIDLLSILPSFNILGETFKVARTARLLKMFRLLKALRYSSQILVFFNVLKKERKVLGSVLLFAVCYIFVTALVMFNVEPQFNPETGDATFTTFFDALYWSAVTLTTVGYGDMCPATDIGRLISMLSAMFGIAIIALPSGIITASYIDELKALKSEKLTERLRKSFRRVVCRANEYHPRYMLVPNHVSTATLLVKQGLTIEQISEIVDSSSEFRLRNMASATPDSKHPNDRIVVEHYPVNKPYGCLIDRGSRITIVATTCRSEAGMGSFCYYLALVGGFNYISKEIERDNDDPVGFYNIDEPIEDENLKMFIDDLRTLTSGNDAWAIMPLSCSSTKERKLHFVHNTKENTPDKETINDMDAFSALYEDVQEVMEKEFSMSIGQHEDYTLTNRNIACKLNKEVNSFSLRVSYDITCWDDKRMDKIYSLASIINKQLLGITEIPIARELQEKGVGYTL
ncbi:MAG: ion transporter [Clostridiales bacterium]|nr:ion transporter [Candidatus Crickella caballi]